MPNDVIVPLHTRTDSLRRRARDLRELARLRWVEAVRELEMGGRDTYLTLLRVVDAHEESARVLERQAEGIERARSETAAAVAEILRRASA